jgi:hypothetical protein
MENNEIMYEGIEMVEDVVADKATGMNPGVAMLIGVGLTLAVGAGIKLVKKGIATLKAKKEQATQHDFVDIDDDEVRTVTGK